MQGIEITDRQNQIWNDVGDSLSASLNIKHLALQYYLVYRQSLMNNKVTIQEPEKMNNIMQIAYFVSQKNQVTFNMRGQRVFSVALSINQIIKKNNDFEDFFLHLKQMLKVITIEDKEVEHQIQFSLKKFKFTMTFHHKFISTFNKIKPSHPQSQLARSLLWLIFILSKQSLQKLDDIIEATCLMAASFIYYLRQLKLYSPKDKQSQKDQMKLDDNKYGGVFKNDAEIQHVILQYFRIKDIAKFQKMQSLFDDLMSSLRKKIDSEFLFYHYHQRNLETVYKKMDQIYQKRLSDHNIDERHFLKERINNVLAANRFTPFGGRRAIGKNKNSHQTDQIFSHRILHYEQEDSETTKSSKIDKNQRRETRQKCGSTLLKNLVNNKTPTRSTPLIRATPTTNAMQMYNWVLQKSNYYKYDNKEININLIMKGGKTVPQNFEDILRLIYGLWKDFCYNQSEKIAEIPSKIANVLLVLAIEIVYFVQNLNQNTLEVITKNYKLTSLEVWQKIDSVLMYDHGMPRSIKQHLLGVQTNIITKQLWNSQAPPFYIFLKDEQRPEISQFGDRLYRRIIHELVYQIFFLSKKLNIIDDENMNFIFMIAQYAIIENPEILLKRNLHLIILCSFYAISKALDLKLSFNSIMTPFTEMNGLSKESYTQLVDDIYLGGDSKKENQFGDIIKFYNAIFVKRTKQLLLHIKYQEGPIEIRGAKVINSNVKDLLPKKMVLTAENKSKTPLQTPFTQALMAYNQSPLLKEKRIKNLIPYVDGKRLLSKNTYNSSEEEKTREETLKQTTSMINKKWKGSRSPDLKFGSTIKKNPTNQDR